MQGYLFYLNKTEKQAIPTSHEIKNIFQSLYGRDIEIFSHTNGRSSFFNFTNENNNYDLNIKSNTSYGYSGYIGLEFKQLVMDCIKSGNAEKQFTNVSGVFTLAEYDSLSSSFNAWNNITGVEPIFLLEDADKIIIGTKAMLISALSNSERMPEYDILSFNSFLSNGYFCDFETPFNNVNVLPPNSKVSVENMKVSTRIIDNSLTSPFRVTPDRKFFDDAADLFLGSFESIANRTKSVSIGLTGGKDSRLIVAALNNMGFDINASTNGYDDTPDVIVAKMIAEKLGISHETKFPTAKGATEFEFDLDLRLNNTIKNSDGMLYAYENLNSISTKFNPNKVLLGGQGGELLRGGFAKNTNLTTLPELKKFLTSRFSKNNNLLIEEAKQLREKFIEQYLNINQSLNPNEILNKFYLEFRCARWSGASRHLYTMDHYSFAPMFDSKLIRKIVNMKTSFGSSEELIYNILSRINPALINIPFADDRWGFEKNGPFSRYDAEEWYNRSPISSRSKLGSFNWRKNIIKTMREEINDTLLSTDNKLLDIIDRKQLSKILSSNTETENLSKYDDFIWSAMSASRLISNQWISSSDNTETKIIVEIPSPTEKQLNPSKNIFISSNELTSVSDKVNISMLTDGVCEVGWNEAKEEDKLYFQTFDNSFSVPSSEKYYNKSKLTNSKHLSVEFGIDKVTIDQFNIDLFLLEFSGNKKVRQRSTTFRILDPSSKYKYEADISENTDSFKIAFKINNNGKSGRFFIDNLFIESN